MKKRLIPILVFLIFFTACSTNSVDPIDALSEEVSHLKTYIIELQASLEEKNTQIIMLSGRIDELEEPITTSTNPISDDTLGPSGELMAPLQIAGIGLGYSKDLVETIIGSDYKEESWEWLDGKKQDKWVYDKGITIKFYDDYVRSIQVSKIGIHVDNGVQVGVDAYSADMLCTERNFEPYIASYNGTEGIIPGWYESDNDELLILVYNEDGDRYNTGLDSKSSSLFITGYELEYLSNYR